MSRRPSRHEWASQEARQQGLRLDLILPGFYRTRLVAKGPWVPVLVRVENSTDDEGRVADRPRLVLYLGAERHERPSLTRWQGRLFPIGGAEYRRLGGVPVLPPADQRLDLNLLPPLFGSTANG